MDEETAQSLAAKLGWVVKEDSGRGWRRVVGSPKPRRIIEQDIIRSLAGEGHIVIACRPAAFRSSKILTAPWTGSRRSSTRILPPRSWRTNSTPTCSWC